MPTVRIQVAEQPTPPQVGKKRGRIKDMSGTLYQALPSFLGMVKVGGTYDLTYKDETFNNASYRVVESIVPAMDGAPAPQGYSAPIQPPRQAPARTYESAPHQDDRGDDIATLAIAKVWLEKVPVGDEAGCLHALRVARCAWKKFKANPDNIETGRQPLENERWEEFPEQ